MENKPTKKAGIDFGLTNVKAYWVNKKGDGEEEMFLSTAEVSRSSLASVLAHSGVTNLCAAGNGLEHGFKNFRQERLAGSLFETEICTQAVGARHLLERQPSHPVLGNKYYLVSIGTGTSYTTCDNDSYCTSLLGSAIGAGTVDGILALAGLKSGLYIDRLLGDKLAKGDLNSLDLMLVEAIPEVKGTMLDRYVASHLAKAPHHFQMGVGESAERLCMSAVSMLVTDVVCRLLLHDKNPACRQFLDPVEMPIIDTVILGTMPHRSKAVRMLLEIALRSIGKNPIFPEHGEYALAVGAYHSINP